MSFRGTRNLHKKLDIVLFFIKLPQSLSFRGTRNLRKKLDLVLLCTKFSQALSFRGTRNLHKKLDVVLFLTSCHNVCPSEERGISTSNSIQFCYSLAEMKNYCWRKLSRRFLLRRKDKQCEERRIFEVVIWKETSAYTVNLNPIPCKFSIEIPSSFTKILRSREIKTSRLRPIK